MRSGPAALALSVAAGLFVVATPAPAEEKRPLPWVWTDAELGVSSVSLRTFSANADTLTAGIFPTSGLGPVVGVGAGFRLVFVTLGARARGTFASATAPDGSPTSFQLWTIDAELGVRVPFDRVEPYVTFSGGYATFGGLGSAVSGLGAGLNVNGLDARLGLGVDYFATKVLSIGVRMDGEALAISRQGVALRDLAAAKQVGTLDEAKARVLEANGSSWGGALTFVGVVGVNF